MEQIDIISTLESLGLPEKAAAIYLSLLGKQKMGVAELARESGIKRATCYEYLDLLLKKDFVIRVPIGKRIMYSAVAPSKVFAEFQKRSHKIEASFAHLERLHEVVVNKPKVTFYEGKRELWHIYEDLSKTVGDTYSIFPADEFFKNFTEAEYDDFDKEISQHAFKSRDLFIPGKYYKKLKEIREKNGEEKLDKKLPDWFKSDVDVLIFSDKVALISLRDLSAVVIENANIAELFRSMHTFMWKAL